LFGKTKLRERARQIPTDHIKAHVDLVRTWPGPLQLRRPPREGLRPLRDPATVHLDEGDAGTGE
jgi:hypothetical protein